MIEHILASSRLIRPEMTLAATLCFLLLIDFFVKGKSVIPAIAGLLGLLLAGFMLITQSGSAPVSIFSNMLAIDGFSSFFKVIILVTTGIIILFSLNSEELQRGTRRLGEYYALLIGVTLGMFLMVSATNLLMMYLSLELASMTSYILSGYTRDADDSSEASLKYVIYGAFSSGMMLYGISVLYGLTGSVDLYGINHALIAGDVNRVALIIAGILTIVGFGYKVSAAPFHFWTPDVYEGAPLTITALLSVASKAAGFAMLIRFFKVAFIDPQSGILAFGSWFSLPGFEWNYAIAILSVLSMTLGNLSAIFQNNLKRLLAYSSIAHAGYMLMGVVVLSNEGIAAILIYFVVYLFMNLGAFYVVMLVANKTGSEDIGAYNGLGYRSPVIGVAMTIFLLSLTGIPPTAGFVGKLYLFAALINAKWFWLAIVGALNSVVSLYYYVRIVRNMFLKEPDGDAKPLQWSLPQLALLWALVIPIILFGLFFSPLVEYAQAAVVMFGVR